MNKCGITLPQIQAHIAQELEEWQEEEEGIGELKSRISKVIKYINDNNNDNIDNSIISNVIWDILNNPLYSSDAIKIEFDLNYFLNSLNTIQSGILINDIENTEKLYNTEEATRRKNASLDFLISAYGSAVDVKRNATILQKLYIVDSCFVGRGNIPGIIGLVENSNLLNYNIRLYQQHLLNQIITYINSLVDISLSTEELQLLQNPVLYISTSSGIQYSGILEKLTPLFDKHLNPNKFTPEILRKLYNSTSENDKRLLNAYNSYIFLSHFDTFLSQTLGKSIQINEFGIKSGKNKYRISDKTNNLMTTWRTTDEIFVENEVDNITKLLITTLPIYNEGTNTVIKDSYLQFGDFTHIIGKIKLIGINPLSKSLVFNQSFISNNENLWESLSENTKNVIKDKSFYEVITSLRRNPRKIFSAIFELLCNDNFKQINEVSSLLSNKYWNKEEKQKLYSLYKGVFSENESIKSIIGNTPAIDYYGFIIQAADSIFKNLFILLYTDAQGNQQTRLLIDLSLYNIKLLFIRDVNAINSIALNKQYETNKQQLYNIKSIYNQNNKLNEVLITVPNTDIKITVNIQTGHVKYIKNETTLTPYNLLQLLRENKNVINFVNDVLPLNISNDSEIFKILEDIANDNFANLLLNLVSHVLTIQHVLNTELKEVKGKALLNKAETIFGGGFKVKYNSEFKQLNVFPDSDSLILNHIANAKAILYGLTTASQIKDSNQASQSLQSLSRLLGSYQSQWTLQNSNSNSASKNLLILSKPELFEGHYTINEAFTKNKNGKKAVKLSVSELTHSALMFNFLPGFTEFDPKNERFIQDGHIGFIASVNSDKNTVGMIKVNLNTLVGFILNGLLVTKAIKDLNSEELEALISLDLGLFYINVLNNINDDFYRLSNFIRTFIPSFPDLNYLFNFSKFNIYWDLITSDPVYGQQWLKYGNSPAEFIKYFTRKYNNTNRLKPIVLIDQVHLTQSKVTLPSGRIVNSFINNDTLIAQIARFQPDYLININFDISSYIDSKTFWKNKQQEVLESLIKCKFEIDLSKNSPETNLLSKYKDWTSKSKKMILGKVTIKGKLYNITSKKDLRLIGIETGYSETDVLSKYDKLEIHPMLQKYNYLEYLFTQEWINSTVGSFIAHKGKGSDDIEIEASRFGALHKRNVSFTALKQQFVLNSLQGISEDYNIAVIEDIKIKKLLLRKSGNSIKPFDGATFVNPFFVHLENNSLYGAKAGINKKQFVHFIDHRTGTGGIIKTAGFGLTNDSIRNSPMDALIMKKMTSNEWIDEFGNVCEVDITKSWKGSDIKYEPVYWQDESGKYFKLLGINKSLESNTYNLEIVEVDISGKEIGTSFPISKKVNSNYTLWLLFGGSHSMSIVGRKLQFSETSIKNVITTMNNVGQLRAKDPNNPNVKYNVSEVSTLDELWQPLKQSDIAYVVTEGAIKQGGANINSSNDFYNTEKRLDFQRIKMYEAGIQLDKEHHATESELSLPTLIVSACTSKGYSIDDATRLYNSLRQCTEIALKTLLDAISQYIKNYGEKTINLLNEEAFKLVIKNLANSSGSESFATTIAKAIDSTIRNSETLKEYHTLDFPLSDNTIFRKVLSTVSSYLTKQGIRIKIPGLLAVLNPSHDRIKLYGNKKFENFYNPNLQLEELLLEYDLKPLSIAQIDLGRTYKIEYNIIDSEFVNSSDQRSLIINRLSSIIRQRGDETIQQYLDRLNLEVDKEINRLLQSGFKLLKYVSIETPGQLKQLRSEQKNGNLSQIIEYVKDGRNLSAYNVRFTTLETLELFLLWELDSVELSHEFAEINESDFLQWYTTKLQTNSYFTQNFSGLNYKQCKQKINLFVLRDISNLSKTAKSPIQLYNEMVQKFNNGEISTQQLLNFLSLLLYRKVNLEELSTIASEVQTLEKIRINGKEYSVNKLSIDIQAYELIMPKTFQKEFGLDTYSDLNEIENDLDYFIKLYLRNKSTIISSLYDVVLKRANGDHIYILDLKHFRDDLGLISIQNELMTIEENGRLYRIDEEGNNLYELLPGTEVFIDNEGHEVIVVSDTKLRSSLKLINHYVSNFKFGTIDFSKSLIKNNPNYLFELVSELETNSRVGKFISNNIRPEDTITIESIINNINQYKDDEITEQNYKEILNEYHPIWIQGRNKHTSFLKSLEVTAARIPSLSKLSYMAMKVVAYDNPNLNNAFVSTLLILLQGSDF